MTDRDKIIKKIRALLEMSMENGATEAEAILAAQKADDLMLQYNLHSIDIQDAEEESYGMRSRKFAEGSFKRRSYHPVDKCLVAIADFCDCKVWLRGYNLIFFGTKMDTEFAWYLTDMIRNAMDTEYNRAKSTLKKEAEYRGEKVHGKTLRTSFMRGMASRINERLRSMKQKRDAQIKDESIKTTGTDLVIVRNDILERKFQSLGLNMSKGYANSYSAHADAYTYGREAANNVNFGRPVGTGSGPLQIGGE